MKFVFFQTLIFSAFALTNTGYGQIQIVLNDLTLIETGSYEITEHFLVTSDGKKLPWHKVLVAEHDSPDRKKKLDEFIREFGLPIRRMKHRLIINDWKSLPEIAEPRFQKIESRKTTGDSFYEDYLTCLACFRGRLATRKRVESLIPFLRLCEIVNQFPGRTIELKSANLLPQELENCFAKQLLPIWFDKESSKQVLKQIEVESGRASNLGDGYLLYMASLQSAAGKPKSAMATLVELNESDSDWSRNWQMVVGALVEIKSQKSGENSSRLQRTYHNLTGDIRAVANLLVAQMITDNQDDYDAAILDLLYVPANFSDRLPTVSAAALSLAVEIANKSGKENEARIIEDELIKNYSGTYHGRRTTNNKR